MKVDLSQVPLERYVRLQAASIFLNRFISIRKDAGKLEDSSSRRDLPTLLKVGTTSGAMQAFIPEWQLFLLSDSSESVHENKQSQALFSQKDAPAAIAAQPGQSQVQNQNQIHSQGLTGEIAGFERPDACPPGQPAPISLPSKSFDAVIAIGVLEALNQQERELLLGELARIPQSLCIIDLPSSGYRKHWSGLVELTLKSEMQRSLQFGLPDTKQISQFLEKAGFEVEVWTHTRLSQWLPYITLFALNPLAAGLLDQELKRLADAELSGTIQQSTDNDNDETAFDLIVAKRKD
ncbi:MAG: class I SAM-dependent methyltransferase [Candidatus Obscuribacterales bacterium]|nr:class I SAM-dependent methyltransferase [Candidatus Obscuribacterales bacterium]